MSISFMTGDSSASSDLRVVPVQGPSRSRDDDRDLTSFAVPARADDRLFAPLSPLSRAEKKIPDYPCKMCREGRGAWSRVTRSKENEKEKKRASENRAATTLLGGNHFTSSKLRRPPVL